MNKDMAICRHSFSIDEECFICNQDLYTVNHKRIEELEKWKQVAIEKNIQDLNRIQELESYVTLIKYLNEHKDDWKQGLYEIAESNKQFCFMINNLIDRIAKLENPKHPYICPVCEGKGSINSKVPGEKNTFQFIFCNACEGRRIVWA